MLYFLLFHPSKRYLAYCLNEIKLFLEKENLTLNPKTRIFNYKNNFIFLGRDKYGNYAKHRDINRKLKKRLYLYKTGFISLNSLISSRICYHSLCPRKIVNSKLL